MLKVELVIDDEESREEMIGREVMCLVNENGVKINRLNIDRMNPQYIKPELKEITIPDFLKKSVRVIR